MPDYGGPELPEDEEREYKENAEASEWGRSTSLAFIEAIKPSKEAVLFEPDGEEIYHIKIVVREVNALLEGIFFNIHDIKNKRSYSFNIHGEILPSLVDGDPVMDKLPTKEEIGADLEKIKTLSKRHIK